MKELKLIEQILLYSACFRKKYLQNIIPIALIVSYIAYGDWIFSIAIGFLIFAYFQISYKFYIKYATHNKDELLKALEKSGRKELEIPDESQAFHLFKKSATCDLPTAPAPAINIKEFEISIVFLGKEHLTLYTKCPKIYIYKLERGAKPKKGKAKPKSACAENREYYYSNFMGAYYDTTEKVVHIARKSGDPLKIGAEKGPGTKMVNEIRKILRA